MSIVELRPGAFKPYDAWIFANITSGKTLNGELNSLSDHFRPMADHLNGLDKKSRGIAFEAMMALRADRAELIAAIADQNPSGPAPAVEQITPMRFATAADIR